MTWPDRITTALGRTPGAVFRRCALQVNPFGYVLRHRPGSAFTDEHAYNAAIVEACRRAGISVVGITDHHTVHTMTALRRVLTDAGITVFPGFEARSSDGVQALVLFEPNATEQQLERHLGRIGASDPGDPNGLAGVDFGQLLGMDWDAAIIAGQLTFGGGLLGQLSGDPRRRAWRDQRLLAGAISLPVDEVRDEGLRRILQGRDPNYLREHPLALIYASDIADPSDVERVNTSCWLKMTEPTVDGLRSAFRDPESRVRLPGEAEPAAHAEFVAAAWTGGFLDGQSLRFSDNLNVLIGGRGVGKSTVIESLRFALDMTPLGAAAQAHAQIVRDVLGPGGTVHLVVRSPHPSPASYLVERVVGGLPVVRDEAGADTGLHPRDVIGGAAFWGQHEIAELEVHEGMRIRLIARFARVDPTLRDRKVELRKALGRGRDQLADVEDALENVRDRLAALPALEEQQRRYQAAGVEDRLHEQSLLVREENLLDIAVSRLSPLRGIIEQAREAAAPDRAFLAAQAIAGLPNTDLLGRSDEILTQLETVTSGLVDRLRAAVDKAGTDIAAVQSQWRSRRDQRQEEFDQRLRDLQADNVDGAEFLRMRQAVEGMLPLRERAARLDHERRLLMDERSSLLADWTTVRQEEYTAMAEAADFANEQLRRKVRVTTIANGDVGPLEQLVRDRVPGRLNLVMQAVADGVDPVEFASLCRQGADAVRERWGVTENQAERLCGAATSAVREIEELDLQPRTEVELNVGTASKPVWRAYGSLSKGQKATAALLLLLVGDRAPGPLVVDQPEDDLDNAFIFQTIVPSMRTEKRRRQFLFASHDPNIPVLGDAELIAELSTQILGDTIVGRVGTGGRLGSIDVDAVREAVEENLEGGRAAFERRRRMYGF